MGRAKVVCMCCRGCVGGSMDMGIVVVMVMVLLLLSICELVSVEVRSESCHIAGCCEVVFWLYFLLT